MRTEMLDAIVENAKSGADIAKKFNVGRSYVSKVKGTIQMLKHALVTEAYLGKQGVVCASCKQRVSSLVFHQLRSTGQFIAVVCGACKRKLGQSDTIDGQPGDQGAGRQDPTLLAENMELKAKLRFMDEFFKSNSEYLFDNPRIVKVIEDNAATFAEVDKLCQA
jgi:uncharacterized CHY-type Zn-finger protein